MFESEELPEDAIRLDRIYAHAPIGALTVAGVSTAIVLALWLAFYWVIFLPRSGPI